MNKKLILSAALLACLNVEASMQEAENTDRTIEVNTQNLKNNNNELLTCVMQILQHQFSEDDLAIFNYPQGKGLFSSTLNQSVAEIDPKAAAEHIDIVVDQLKKEINLNKTNVSVRNNAFEKTMSDISRSIKSDTMSARRNDYSTIFVRQAIDKLDDLLLEYKRFTLKNDNKLVERIIMKIIDPIENGEYPIYDEYDGVTYTKVVYSKDLRKSCLDFIKHKSITYVGYDSIKLEDMGILSLRKLVLDRAYKLGLLRE